MWTAQPLYFSTNEALLTFQRVSEREEEDCSELKQIVEFPVVACLQYQGLILCPVYFCFSPSVSLHDSWVRVQELTCFYISLKVFFSPFPLLSQAEGDRLPPGHTVSQLETCKIRSIRAGTLERLVETLLTAFGDNDLTYTSIFLSTYRAFATTQSVLELLLDRCVR